MEILKDSSYFRIIELWNNFKLFLLLNITRIVRIQDILRTKQERTPYFIEFRIKGLILKILEFHHYSKFSCWGLMIFLGLTVKFNRSINIPKVDEFRRLHIFIKL